MVGAEVGDFVGAWVGEAVESVGGIVGAEVGKAVGAWVGESVGGVGAAVGARVGDAVGAAVGASVALGSPPFVAALPNVIFMK